MLRVRFLITYEVVNQRKHRQVVAQSRTMLLCALHVKYMEPEESARSGRRMRRTLSSTSMWEDHDAGEEGGLSPLITYFGVRRLEVILASSKYLIIPHAENRCENPVFFKVLLPI